jgi:hypothetical protein
MSYLNCRGCRLTVYAPPGQRSLESCPRKRSHRTSSERGTTLAQDEQRAWFPNGASLSIWLLQQGRRR